MSRDIQALVEEQISRWRIAQQTITASADQVVRPNIITMACALGSCGDSISRRVGEMLHIPVHDRDIVDYIASNARVSKKTVEALEEGGRGAVEDFIASLFRERGFDRNDYLRALVRTVTALWMHGPCVLVGRGSVHVVPRTHALTVRTTASAQVRAERVAQRQELELDEARQRVLAADKEQEQFHRQYFAADVHDSSTYDVVLNTSDLGVEGSAVTVVDLFRRKFNGRWYSPLAGARAHQRC